MSMFDTTGKSAEGEARKANTLRKLARMKAALRHEEPDRVPISDFFWGGFIRRWREELGLAADANPYYHYDLDWIVTVPNIKHYGIYYEERERAQQLAVEWFNEQLK